MVEEKRGISGKMTGKEVKRGEIDRGRGGWEGIGLTPPHPLSLRESSASGEGAGLSPCPFFPWVELGLPPGLTLPTG